MCTPGGGGCLRDRGPHRNKTNLDWSCLDLWFEAAFEQQASSRTSKQLCTICSHLSHMEQDRQQARTFFPFFTLPSHAVAYRVRLKSHSPTEVIHFPLTNWWAMMLCPAHTLFNTFYSGIAGNIQPVWGEHGCFFFFPPSEQHFSFGGCRLITASLSTSSWRLFKLIPSWHHQPSQ